MNITRCLSEARASLTDDDVELADDLDMIEKSAADYRAEGMEAKAAEIRAVQEALAQAIDDHSALLEEIRGKLPEPAAEPEPTETGPDTAPEPNGDVNTTRRDYAGEIFNAAITPALTDELGLRSGFDSQAYKEIQSWLDENREELTATDAGREAYGQMTVDGEVNKEMFDTEYLDALFKETTRRAKVAAKKEQVLRFQSEIKTAIKDGYFEQFPDAVQNGVNVEQYKTYRAGFMHRLEGGTLSNIPKIEDKDTQRGGYDDASKWLKTDTGKEFAKGIKVKKGKRSTGVVLKRVMDVDSTKGDTDKMVDRLIALTARPALFDPLNMLPEDASLSTTAFLEEMRKLLPTFVEWAGGREGGTRASWGESYKGALYSTAASHNAEDPNYGANKIKRLAEAYTKAISDIATTISEAQPKTPVDVAEAMNEWFIALGETQGRKIEAVLKERYGEQVMDDGDLYRLFANMLYKLERDYVRDEESRFMRVAYETTKERSRQLEYFENQWSASDIPERKVIRRPRLDKIGRAGFDDTRNNENVSLDRIKEEFGFANVQRGEGYNARKMQDHLNYGFDAFTDLATILGIDPKHVSIGGRLYMAFGALGHGRHAAHFSPNHPHPETGGRVAVINLTATSGDGSLAHEYMHALDFLLTDKQDQIFRVDEKKPQVMPSHGPIRETIEMLRTRPHSLEDIKRDIERQKEFYKDDPKALAKAIRSRLNYFANDLQNNKQQKLIGRWYGNRTNYHSEAIKLGKEYWANATEMFARAGESWIYDKMKAAERADDYLVSGWVDEKVVSSKSGYRGTPYPVGSDRAFFNEVFDVLFEKGLTFSDEGVVVNNDFSMIEHFVQPQLNWIEEQLGALPTPEQVAEEEEAAEEARIQALRDQLKGAGRDKGDGDYIPPTTGVNLDLDEVEEDTPYDKDPENWSDEDISAILEEAMTRNEEGKQEPARPEEKAEPAAPAGVRSTADVAKDLFGNTSEAVEGALDGLAALFGVDGSTKLRGGFPGDFNQETYNKAKPHFQVAWNAAKAAAGNVRELMHIFIDQLTKAFGAGIRPYLMEWVKEHRSEVAAFAKDKGKELDGSGAQPTKLTQAFVDAIENGSLPSNNNALRAFVAEKTGQTVDNARLKIAQEELEAAQAIASRNLIQKGGDQKAIYDELVARYASQPNLSIRTSTSIANQAYSTPAPLAFMAARIAQTQGATVYEPSAGNGMLLIDASPNAVVANEIDDTRARNLNGQGFNVIQSDAVTAITEGRVPPAKFDAVVTNPPFGKADPVTVQGYKLTKIDHIIAARSLLAMKSEGRATLILGADKTTPGALGPSERVFFNWLYAHYNVVGNFEVSGKLYSRQGAAWPVRVVTIAGRNESDAIAPPALPAKRANTWEEVYAESEQARQQAEVVQSNVDDGGFIERITVSEGIKSPDDTGPVGVPNGEQTGVPGGADGSGRGQGTGGGAGRGGVAGPDGGRSGADTTADGSGAARPESGGLEQGEPAETQPATQTRQPNPDGRFTGDEGDLGDFQVSYAGSVPDDGKMGRVLTPTNMRDAIYAALKAIEEDVGDLQEYVRGKLGYESKEALRAAMMPLQIDTTAAAIYNIEHGTGVIIADQTGIGKGRQAAGIIRYAKEQGKIPVFMTEKADLFSDMHRDLTGIGSASLKPLIINQSGKVLVEDPDSGELVTLHSSPYSNVAAQRSAMQEITATGKLPDGYDMVFITYSQVRGEDSPTSGARREMMNAISPNAVLILDESHNASGEESFTGEYMRGLVGESYGVTYLSATYSKRASTMGLYFRTVLGKMVDSVEDLVDQMAKGGEQLQAIMSNALARAGQLFRRERSYDGINTNIIRDTKNRDSHRYQSDEVTRAMRAMVRFSTAFAEGKKGWQGWLIDQGYSSTNSRGKIADTIVNTHFAAQVHNLVRQILLGLKVDAAADMAIEAVKRGEKPVIGTEMTMGSFLTDYKKMVGVGVGEVIPGFEYKAVLTKYLLNSRRVKIRRKDGSEDYVLIPVEALTTEAQEAYRAAEEEIANADIDIPVSPLDWMRKRLTDAGIKVMEITGRDFTVDYSDPARPVLATKAAEEKNKNLVRNKFNNGEVDALLVNVSGATGISLHSSVDFKDQRKRRMIIVQAMQDINKYMQLLGRINRTGQVAAAEDRSENASLPEGVPETYGLPEYDILALDVPAEIRPTSVLMRKMRSLNANVSSNTESESSLDSLDLLNKYGDQVVFEMMKEDPQLFAELGGTAMDATSPPENFAQKSTGMLALLPIERQEMFYDEVAPRYETLIQYLDSVGQNELKITVKDFKAEPIEGTKDLLFQTPAEISYIVPNAYLQKYKVNKLTFPPTADEVRAQIEKETGGVDPEAYTEAVLIGKEGADTAHKEDLRKKIDDWSSILDQKEITEERKLIANNKIAILKDQLEAFDGEAAKFRKKINQDYKIGKMMNVDIGGGLMTGVIVRIKDTSKPNGTNPYADSKTEITFMVNGDMRTFRMPISAIERRDVIQGRTFADMDTAFSAERASSTTEDRWLITGNIMGGLTRLADEQKREIAYFTMKDGEVVPGVIMPLSFNPENAGIKRDVSMRYPMAVAEFLRDYREDVDVSRFGVATPDNSMRIVPIGYDAYRIRVPASKKEGGKWHQNARIVKITGDFVSDTGGTNFMDVQVSFDQLVQALEIVLEDSGLYVLESQAEKAQPYVDKHGKSPKYSRIGPNVQSRTVSDVRAEVNKILKPGHAMLKSGRLRVVQSDSDLPGHLQHESGGVRGVVDPLTNNIYIVADNVGGNVSGVVMHELGVHVGLKALLGDKYAEVIRQLRGLKAIKKDEALRAYARVPNDTDPAHVDEEALGYLVEDEAARSTGIVRKIINAVRAWMFQHGILVRNLTPGDMVAMAAAAARAAGRDNATAYPLTVDGQVTPLYSRSEQGAVSSAVSSIKERVEKIRDRSEEKDPNFIKNQQIREKDKPFWTKVRKELKRQLAPGGLLPNAAFQFKIWRDSQFQVGELDVQNIVAHFDQAVKSGYGKRTSELDEVTMRRLNSLLTVPVENFTEAAAKMQVPEVVVEQIGAMREYIRRYSVEYGEMLQREIDAMEADKDDPDGSDSPTLAARKSLLETIQSKAGRYAHRSYQVYDDPNWVKNLPAEVINDARDYINERAEEQASKYDEWAVAAEDKGDLEKADRHRGRAAKLRDPQRAERIINSLVKDGTAFDSFEGYIKESKLGAKDLSILKKKKDIAPEIRALLGEYQDARLNFAKTATKQNRLIYNTKFLEKIVEVGLGDFLFTNDNRPPEAWKKIASKSATYDPLGGYYTFPEVEQAFREALGKENLPDWLRAVIKYNGMIKFGKTVLSPTTAARNWFSAQFFAMANGHFDFRQLKKSHESFKSYMQNKGDAVAYLRKLKELGVVYDTPYAGEMMRLMEESSIEDWTVGGKREGLRWFLDRATKMYQFGDDYWKIMGFENEKALMMKHKGMSEADAEIAAAERIRNTYPTYSMTGKFVNQLRRFPLAGTFVSFPSEIIRTTWHMLNYLKEDMKDPDLRPLAMRRIAGLAVASGATYALQAVFMQMFGVDDDEEEAFRQLAAPWQKNSNIVPVGRDTNGNLRFVDVSFMDPYNYWKRPINAILRGQPVEDLMYEIGREILGPFFGQDIAFSAIMEIFMNKRETGGRVFNPQDNPLEQTKDMAGHLWKNLQPGATSNMTRMYQALEGKVSPSGKRYDVVDELWANIGVRISTHDPRAALYYKSFEFRDMKRDATSILTNVARDLNVVSDSDLKAAFARSMIVRSRAYKEMAKLVSAARSSGMPEYRLRQVLSQSGVSKADVNALLRSEVPAYAPSRGYLKQAVNKARILMPERAPDLEARRKLLRELPEPD
jgi:hypothetical protein